MQDKDIFFFTFVNGFIIWTIYFVVDSGSADRIQRFDNLQKKALRRIEYCINVENRQDKDVLLKKYKIEDLRLRRKRNLVKIMHTLSANSENLKTVSAETERELRSIKKVKMKNDFTSKIKSLTVPSTEESDYGMLYHQCYKKKKIRTFSNEKSHYIRSKMDYINVCLILILHASNYCKYVYI